jgi:SAM-dependent methyltransferase
MREPSAVLASATRLACVCCRGRGFRPLLERHELGFQSERPIVLRRYEICARCGLVRKRPQPTAEALRDYYERCWQFTEPRPPACFASAARWIAEALGAYGCLEIPRGLDVGAKDSALLSALTDAGVPVRARDALDPQPKGAEVRAAWLGEGTYEHPTRCELVAATHVLEHVHDPRLFLEDLGRIVAEGGFLYLEVPALEIDGHGHADNINRAHLWHFPVPALARLLAAAPRGFRLVRLDLDGSVVDWPVTRALVRRGSQDEHDPLARAFRLQEQAQVRACERALEVLARHDPEESAIYGACENLLRLWATVGSQRWDERFGAFTVVDLHRQEFLERPVATPEAGLRGKRFALIATRHYSSIRDIERYLAERFPHVAPVRLFD